MLALTLVANVQLALAGLLGAEQTRPKSSQTLIRKYFAKKILFCIYYNLQDFFQVIRHIFFVLWWVFKIQLGWTDGGAWWKLLSVVYGWNKNSENHEKDFWTWRICWACMLLKLCENTKQKPWADVRLDSGGSCDPTLPKSWMNSLPATCTIGSPMRCHISIL